MTFDHLDVYEVGAAAAGVSVDGFVSWLEGRVEKENRS